MELTSTINSGEFREFQNRPITFHPKNLDFEGSHEINVQNTSKRPITTSDPKIEIWSSPDTLEGSDHLHTVSTCETHEYYRLRKFQNHPTTFHLQILDFEGTDGFKFQNDP